MEFLFEPLIQIFGELIVQLVFELGFRGLIEPFRTGRPTNVFLAVVGYVCMGLLAGLISLWIVPKHVIVSDAMRYVNFAVTPILMGILFELLGRRSQRRGKKSGYLIDSPTGFPSLSPWA